MSNLHLFSFTRSTLTNFIFLEENKHVNATGELSQLLINIQTVAKSVNSLLRNPQRDCRKLQQLANEIFVHTLSSSHTVGLLISQEGRKVFEVDKDRSGKYIVTFDPLDGATTLDAGISVGSLFGILLKENPAVPPVAEDAISHKNKMVAAGYILYGSATVLVMTTGQGVHEFILDDQTGEFYLTDKDMKIPKQGCVYSANEGFSAMWIPGINEYLSGRKLVDKKKTYSCVITGSLVGDAHRVLKQGGIIISPPCKDMPRGVLYALTQCRPLAFIIDRAGGLCTDGWIDIALVDVTELNQRCPFIAGSKRDVEEFLEMFRKYHK